MQFEDKKLTPDAVNDLFQCPVHTVHPYTLMLAPVYVFMKRNQKFVSVKAPLDFFTPEELEKLKFHETFYLPKFVKNSVRYQTAARIIHAILKKTSVKPGELEYAPYELSNEILKVIGKLWGKEMKIEPFFMAIFAHELCDSFKPELMAWARETNVSRHDWGLLLSGAFVFLALHLGYYDLFHLNYLRNDIYKRTIEGENWDDPKSEYELMVKDINILMGVKRALAEEDLIIINSEWTNRLSQRLERVRNQFAKRAEVSPSIYGEEGFAA